MINEYRVTLTSGYTPFIAQIQCIPTIVVGAVGTHCLAGDLWKSRWGACIAGATKGVEIVERRRVDPVLADLRVDERDRHAACRFVGSATTRRS